MPDLPRAILFDLDDTLIRAYAQPEEAWARLHRHVGKIGLASLSVHHASTSSSAVA